MLVACSACGAQISPAAPSCPRCGQPRASGSRGRGVQTIQRTGKDWKALHVLATLIVFACGVWLGIIAIVNHDGGEQLSTLRPGIGLACGILLYFVARIGAWWNNA